MLIAYITILFFSCLIRVPVHLQMQIYSLGLNSIYFETIEKQYKYYTNLSCHGLFTCIHKLHNFGYLV